MMKGFFRLLLLTTLATLNVITFDAVAENTHNREQKKGVVASNGNNIEFIDSSVLKITNGQKNAAQPNKNLSHGSPIVATLNAEKSPSRDWIWEVETEPYDTGWALYLDNDLLAMRSSDQDYTGGLSLTLSGHRATQYSFTLDPILTFLDQSSRFETQREGGDRELHSLEVGFTVFTPANIVEPLEQHNDRPYASLLYLANTHETINFSNDTAWISSFSLGILGSSVVSNVQTKLHQLIGSDKPVGWENQISNGGELTARYSVAKQSLYDFSYQDNFNFEVSTTLQASIGYISELSFGMAARLGSFNSPWYSFRPQFNDYSEKSATIVTPKEIVEEFYFWAGFNFHLRGYNALLQGQFKSSDNTYSFNEMRHLVADSWIGVTKQFRNGWRLSYLLRGQSSEVKKSKADRSVIWGGFIISKSW